MSTGVAARVALAAALLAAHVTASPSRDVLWERVGVFSDGRLSRLLSDVGAVCGRVDELLLSASPCGQADRDGASEATERQLRRLFGASYPYSVHCVDVTAPDVASILSQPASCLWVCNLCSHGVAECSSDPFDVHVSLQARGRAAELDAWHTWLQDALPREWPVSVVVLIEDARGVHSPSDAGWQHSRSDEQFLSLIDSSAAGWYISCFGDVRSDGGVLRWCGDVLRDRGSVTRRQPPLAVHDTGGDGLASEGPASETSLSRCRDAVGSSDRRGTDCHAGECPSTDAKLERLFDELHQQQFPASCEDRRLLVFRYSSLEYQGRAIQGFSVVFQHIASALTMARASNRTLVEVRTGADSDAGLCLCTGSVCAPRALLHERVLRSVMADLDPWNRAPLVPCGGAKFDCYFKQLAGCAFVPETLADLDALPRLDMERLLEVALEHGRTAVTRHPPPHTSSPTHPPISTCLLTRARDVHIQQSDLIVVAPFDDDRIRQSVVHLSTGQALSLPHVLAGISELTWLDAVVCRRCGAAVVSMRIGDGARCDVPVPTAAVVPRLSAVPVQASRARCWRGTGGHVCCAAQQ
jgi:hypothetical protein